LFARTVGLFGLAAAFGAGSFAGSARLADAAEHRDAAGLRELLKQHADVNLAQPDGATALHWAAHWDDAETTGLLIRSGARVDAANDLGITPLHLACNNGSDTVAAILLKAGADPNLSPATGETALMIAARTGNVALVKTLLANKADVNRKDSVRAQTALMWAVSERHSNIVETLISSGADVNAHSRGEFTPLLFAARAGDIESTRILLAAGARVNDAAPDGSTPLVIAGGGEDAIAGRDFKLLVSPSGHQAVAMLLLGNGADPARTDSFGRTALHVAVETGKKDLVNALLARGANPNVRMTKDELPLPGDYVARNGFAGATPFWLAARDSSIELMQMLVAAGADPNILTNEKISPLMVAEGANQNESRLPPEARILEAVRLCAQLGNDVNQIASNGQTPAHYATEMGEDPVIQFLFDRGAKLDVKDRRGRTPLDIALNNPSRPRPKTAALLRKLTGEANAAGGQ
jgi:ankyrin repeat protein